MKKSLKHHRSLLALSLLLGIIFAVVTVLSAKILQEVIDAALTSELTEFWQILIFTLIFFAFTSLLTYFYGRINTKIINLVLADYRLAVYQGTMAQNYQDFHKNNSGEYLSALTNDLKLVEEHYLKALFATIQYSFILIATIIMLISLSVKVTIALFLSVSLMFIIPSLLGKNLQTKQAEVSSRLEKFTKQSKDIFAGFEVIKSFNAFTPFNQIFKQANNRVKDSKLAADNLLVLNESASNMLGTLCQFVVVFTSAYLIIQGELTAGTSIALIQLSGSFIMPIITILTNLPKIKGITPIIEKLDRYTQPSENLNKKLPFSFNTAIEAKQLSFGYEEQKNILQQIDLKIEKGKKYVFAGKSGCGKSTLAQLLSGYYQNYHGQLLMDGKDYQKYDIQATGNLISNIHQNVYMFDDSLINNVTLYGTYSAAELKQALKKSGVSNFSTSLETHTTIGENGNRLSGGQKQRVAIARAMIRNTPILILDEGTSALDKQTAYEIEEQLLQTDLTLITITHNLDPQLLTKYDEIIYLEQGKIHEQGSFPQLMNNNHTFAQFYKGLAENTL